MIKVTPIELDYYLHIFYMVCALLSCSHMFLLEYSAVILL